MCSNDPLCLLDKKAFSELAIDQLFWNFLLLALEAIFEYCYIDLVADLQDFSTFIYADSDSFCVLFGQHAELSTKDLNALDFCAWISVLALMCFFSNVLFGGSVSKEASS